MDAVRILVLLAAFLYGSFWLLVAYKDKQKFDAKAKQKVKK